MKPAAQARFTELLKCAVCLDTYTRPKMLPCQHTFCFSCLETLCEDKKTVPCPLCKRVHKIPKAGVASLEENFVINNLLSISNQKDDMTCCDCQEAPVVSLCAHCDKQVCAPCLVQHGELTSELRTSFRYLKENLPEKRLHPDDRSKLQASMDALKNEVVRMKTVFDEAIQKLVSRRNHLESFLDVVSRIHGDLLHAPQDLADESYTAELSHKLLECKTTESLQRLKDEVSDLRTTSRLVLQMRGDQFKFVGDSKVLNLETFGQIEFGQAIVDIKGRYEVGSDSNGVPTTEAVSLPVVNTSPTAPTYQQNQLPINVNYTKKGSSRTTIIGQGEYARDVTKQLLGPFGGAYHVARNQVYVADFRENRIMVYNVSGQNGRVFYGVVQKPRDVAISGNGEFVYVIQRTALCKLTLSGEVVQKIESFREKSLKSCSSVVSYQNQVAVVDGHHRCVIVYNERGEYVRHFGEETLKKPLCIAVNGNGDCYVTDSVSSCVHVFSWNGAFLETFSQQGRDVDIAGITIDGDGYVCVSRPHSNRIDVYDPQRRLLTSFGEPGKRPGCLNFPSTLCLLPDGRLIVCDTDNNRLQIC